MPIINYPNTPGVTQGGVKITMAGVDITAQVDEYSIDLKDTLGQGAGSGSGASPRASTFAFISSLGPVASAVGSGTKVTVPTLVRNGEVVIYDANGTKIFGGYAVKFTDQTDKTQVFTKVEGVDYWQSLSRIVVNQIFSGQTDIQIITTLFQTYAPWVTLQYLPGAASMYFASKNYRNKTLLDCLQDIIDSTGNQAWIDPYKAFHYVSPSFAQTAPFALSNAPDFRTSYQIGVDEYDVDDTAAINRVFFFGGKKPSNDFPQDISTQANGSNTTFMLAYYPREASDGKVHVTVNGVAQALGYLSGTTSASKLKSQGGTSDVLINADAHTLIFNVAPAAGATVICKYRYELPLMVTLTSPQSYQFYGTYLDGTLADTSVIDTNIAVQRCKILLLEQAFGLVTLKARCWRAGLQAGMAIRVDHSIRNIHNTYIIQEVDTKPMGNGFFEYALTLGAWNWNLVDLLNHLIRAASAADTSSQEDTVQVDDQELYDQMHASLTVSKIQANYGGYKAHASALSDGHDAYAGFCSISPNYVASVLADTPIRFYPMDDTSGVDISGTGQTGTVNGTTSTGASPLVNAILSSLNFDGTTNYINVPMNGIVAGGDWTLEMWVNPTTFAQVGGVSPRAFTLTIDGTNGFMLTSTPSGAWMFAADDSTGEIIYSHSPGGGYATGSWYHVVGSYKKSTRATQLYVNGSLVPNTDGGSGYGRGSVGCTIMSRTDGLGYQAGKALGAAIYNSVLSPARVLAHYNMGTLGHE